MGLFQAPPILGLRSLVAALTPKAMGRDKRYDIRLFDELKPPRPDVTN
jgi:hypothetical protein